MRRWRPFLAFLIPVVVIALGVGVLVYVAGRSPAGGRSAAAGHPSAGSHPRSAAPQSVPPPSPSSCKTAPDQRVFGVAINPPVEASEQSFAAAVKVHPSLTEVYTAFGRPFAEAEAAEAVKVGTTPVIQLNPRKASLADIAAGKYDAYLEQYGKALKAFHCQVIVSFAHEMNGFWYPWGCGHTSAAVFVAAWRHLVTVVTKAGASNVIWMWTANVEARGDCPIASRYPGNKYVTWVGLDGYLRRSGTRFKGIFGPSIAQIHHFTSKPILLAETGVLTKVAGAPDRIQQLFQGAAQTKGVIGLVYFDLQTALYGDYRPQDNPAALAAFRKAAASYLAG